MADAACEDFCGLSSPEGSMIYHPKMLSDNKDLQSHITEFEPELSQHFSDIGLLQKTKCRTFTQDGKLDYQIFSFNVNRLKQSVNIPNNVGYLRDINVILVVKSSYPEQGRCQTFDNEICR